MAKQSPQRTAPPIPFLTAVWAGMSHEDILTGLRNGDIVRPARLPDWVTELDNPTGLTTGADPQPGATVDRARVQGWFNAIDPDLSPGTFDAIWNKAGASDAARATKLTSYLSNLLLGQGPPGSEAAALDGFLDDGPTRHAKIVDLSGKTGEDLAALAKSDIGYRYALGRMDSLAVTGNDGLFAKANADGSLDLLDATTGDALVSDAWLADRGKFLAWKMGEESGQSIAVAGTQDWTFIDRGTKGADGKPFKLEIKTGAVDAGQNQVVFGTGDDEVFRGVSGSDRIYAGAGDDVLRGGAGGDRLEGGDGDDLAMGGAGNDELSGGRGDDELDGGRGDDRLEGGRGNDTYIVDSGDGADTIVDADGIGSIELDGDALDGVIQQGSDGKWTSDDGNVAFAFEGDLAVGGTLTISTYADGANGEGSALNTVTVNNWKNGDLGITLAGDAIGDDGQSSPPGSTIESEVPVTSTADITSETWEDQGALSLDGGGSVTGAASNGAMQAIADTGSDQAAHHAAGEGAIESQFDFDAAFTSLMGNSDPTLHTIDPTSYRQGIEAFAGVLEPPDFSAVHSGDTAEFGAVTEAAMADALAADYASDAFDTFEPRQAIAIAPVDVASVMESKQARLHTSRSAAG